MKKSKIYDCITFFRENFITNVRFEILKNVTDYFVICESRFDHRGKKKDLNFKLKNNSFKKKIIYIVLDKPFPINLKDEWKRQAYQREFLFEGIKNANPNDYIMFSDPDEIPNPKILKNIFLKKKVGIFFQKCFTYKVNLFNNYESPWEGTRIIKKKDLISFDFLRQSIKSKNLKYPWWRFDKEKNIEIFKDGGWHFNFLLDPKEISVKLKTYAHKEFKKFSRIDLIKKNIKNKKDLFNRSHIYKKVELDSTFPDYIKKNLKLFNKYLI